MSTILAAEDVSYTYISRYQRVEALKHVSCSFEEGSFYAITGRSGSGKSTLLSLLAGLDIPTQGDIFYNGKSLKTIDRNRYRRDTASVIYQSYNLFPLLTALENVMYPMELQGRKRREAAAAAAKLLCEVGIGEEMHRKFPQMLSGGEQQRVAIARAIGAGGKLLLADEPTGNLDSANEKMVVELIKTLAHERSLSAIVVTHNEYVYSEVDKVFVLSDGVMQA
jgi:ABC-type lipoprotein export system ATPase subunit